MDLSCGRIGQFGDSLLDIADFVVDEFDRAMLTQFGEQSFRIDTRAIEFAFDVIKRGIFTGRTIFLMSIQK